jgi:hypothetical protein
VPANPWELRADVRPLELAAQRWEEIGTLMSRRGDEIVDAAARATEGWEAAAAEGYEHHRRQVLADVDRFTSLAAEISGSLRAISSILTSSQKELDRAWVTVATVPHDVVGESRHLVFHPSQDDDRGKVTRGHAEAEEIRRRLTLSLDEESTRLRGARAELVLVRTELEELAGGTFARGPTVGADDSGVGTVATTGRSTTVLGTAQSGVGALPPIAPIAPIAVSLPELGGSSAGLTPLAAAAGTVLGGRRERRTTDGSAPPVGGMAVGGMGARAGTMARGAAGSRSGPARSATPRLEGQGQHPGEVAAARAAREKDAAREATRAALEEKRAARAARRARRVAEREQIGRDGETVAETGAGGGRRRR